MLSRDQILANKKLATETVPVPEWGGEVIVRELSGRERDAFEKSIIETEDQESLRNIRAKLAVRSMVDEQGNPLFSHEDTEVLGELSATALNRIFSVAQRLSRIRRKDVEELEKNSGTGRSGSSPSDSPVT